MAAADQEAGVPGFGDLLDGLANVLPDAAEDPVREEVDGSDGRQEGVSGRSAWWDTVPPTHRMYPSMEAVHMMLSVTGRMQSTDSASRAKRSLVAPKPFQLKM